MSRARIQMLIIVVGLIGWGLLVGFSVRHVVYARDIAYSDVKPHIPEVREYVETAPTSFDPSYPAAGLQDTVAAQWEPAARRPSYSKAVLADVKQVPEDADLPPRAPGRL